MDQVLVRSDPSDMRRKASSTGWDEEIDKRKREMQDAKGEM